MDATILAFMIVSSSISGAGLESHGYLAPVETDPEMERVVGIAGG